MSLPCRDVVLIYLYSTLWRGNRHGRWTNRRANDPRIPSWHVLCNEITLFFSTRTPRSWRPLGVTAIQRRIRGREEKIVLYPVRYYIRSKLFNSASSSRRWHSRNFTRRAWFSRQVVFSCPQVLLCHTLTIPYLWPISCSLCHSCWPWLQ